MTKLVINLITGTKETLPLTDAELAQQQVDFATSAAEQAAEDVETARQQTIVADASRAELLTKLKTSSPAEIEAFVRGKINADGVTDLASARACFKRVEIAIATLTKLAAFTAR
jgi:hypothetical protein